MSRLVPHTLIAAVALTLGAAATATFGPGSAWEVKYSPRGGCTELAVSTIEGARTSILVQGYGFTSRPVADALIAAHKRGVKVEIILDKSNREDGRSLAKTCASAGIPVWIDSHHPIAHNKVMVLDGKVVLTGSFNWTAAAETGNAENLLRIEDRGLAKSYSDNWQEHKGHSAPI